MSRDDLHVLAIWGSAILPWILPTAQAITIVGGAVLTIWAISDKLRRRAAKNRKESEADKTLQGRIEKGYAENEDTDYL